MLSITSDTRLNHHSLKQIIELAVTLSAYSGFNVLRGSPSISDLWLVDHLSRFQKCTGIFRCDVGGCKILRSNAGTPKSWVYSDTAVQTLKAPINVQTRLSTRIQTPPCRRPGVPAIAPKTTFVTGLLVVNISYFNRCRAVLLLVTESLH